MTSEARIRANQANAARSTGPRTAEGKGRSRANAFKHGLCAEVVGFEDAEESSGLSARGFRLDAWLCKQVSSLGIRIEQAQGMQEAARERASLRAELVWDDDRRFEAVKLGGRLAARPQQVLEEIRRTLQGCEWLIGQWAMLARAAGGPGGWTSELTKLAFDLLGTPRELREGRCPGDNLDGKFVPPAELARRQIDDLKRRQKAALRLDAAERERAEAGLSDDAEIRRFRRYETSLDRRLRWALDLIRELTATPASDSAPASEPESEAEELASPKSARPTPAGPTTGRSTLGPVPEPSRAERRLMKAEARREGKKRKLELCRS